MKPIGFKNPFSDVAAQQARFQGAGAQVQRPQIQQPAQSPFAGIGTAQPSTNVNFSQRATQPSAPQNISMAEFSQVNNEMNKRYAPIPGGQMSVVGSQFSMVG